MQYFPAGILPLLSGLPPNYELSMAFRYNTHTAHPASHSPGPFLRDKPLEMTAEGVETRWGGGS